MSTIRSSREIDHVFQVAERAIGTHIIMLATPTPTGRDQDGRVACVAGKKLGNAPTRNRIKRVLRAAVRDIGGPWPRVDVVLVGRPRCAGAHTPEVVEDLARLVRKLQVAGQTPC